MWIVHAVLVHIALLGSIFVIYFRSPVITGLRPQNGLSNPPAQRLVLIVTDGLRAESFFHNNCEHIPNIRRLICRGGLVGVSETRVPTESRPGHIALIAGLYEDPSAVYRGWKSNPIDFDNLFNRSSHAYAWGAMDVLHIFSKITGEDKLMIDGYNEYDFTGRNDPKEVDQWVFERVGLFLDRRAIDLQSKGGVVFFLHLLGLDISGHIHKPGSKLFLDTLHSTEKGVAQVYELFEQMFPDGKTAYILTSDHGMTNHGSHGAGDPYERDTPFLFWGAGINNWTAQPFFGQRRIRIDNQTVPIARTIEQAQMAPLMSALIGAPPPMNNFGMLPPGILNVTSEYAALATYTNALQLVAQFEALLNAFEKGAFSKMLPSFKRLNAALIHAFHAKSRKLLEAKTYSVVIEDSYEVMQNALDGIEYYHTYYQSVLLVCTSLAILIWMFCLITFTMSNTPMDSLVAFSTPFFFAVLLLSFIFLQRIPLAVAFYMLFPVLLWALCVRCSHGKWHWLQALATSNNLSMLVMAVIAAVLMVCSFFRREFVTVVFLLFCSQQFKAMQRQGTKFYLWVALSGTISVFPLLPVVMGGTNDTMLLIGALLTLGRAFLVKSNIPRWLYGVAVAGLLNTAFCIYQHSKHEGTPLLCRMLSWLFLAHCLLAPFYVTNTSAKAQVELVFFCLTTAYLLLCISYEAIFMVLLSSQLMLTFSKSGQFPADYADTDPREDLAQTFQYALAILIYTLFSFFGAGNIASVSSFDPNVMRCFITTFSPWIIMSLVVVKLFIPVLLNVVIIYGTLGHLLDERRVAIAMLFICDVMGLNFLYLVRNKGSWLQIGSSISHFVIMESTTLSLVSIMYIAKIYLRVTKFAEVAHGIEKIK